MNRNRTTEISERAHSIALKEAHRVPCWDYIRFWRVYQQVYNQTVLEMGWAPTQ